MAKGTKLCEFEKGEITTLKRLGKSHPLTTTSGQSEPGSNGNRGVHHILQSS